MAEGIRVRPGSAAMLPCVAVVLAMGCAELGLAGPDVDLVTSETYPALDGAEGAPGLPGMIGSAGLSDDLEDAASAWEDSWEKGGLEGHLLRARSYEWAVPALAEEMDSEDVAAKVNLLNEVLSEAKGINRDRLPTISRRELARAKDLGNRAEAALEEGSDRERVLRTVLEAGDALRALSPESVAREMIRTAERSLEEAEAGGPLSTSHGGNTAGGNHAGTIPSQDLERARRLARGAERAFERGEHRKAIQRAFYAHQIAENGGTR